MKLASILLLVWSAFALSVMPSGDFTQLHKVKSLVTHFYDHQEETDLSFWEFMWLHYSPASNHDDPEHDSELPFHQFFTAFATPFIPSLFQYSVAVPPITKTFKPFYSNLYQFQWAKLHLPPPKL